jgi:hypothetical protein
MALRKSLMQLSQRILNSSSAGRRNALLGGRRVNETLTAHRVIPH